MQSINCKIHLELNWNNNCLMYGADTYAAGDNANIRETTCKLTSRKLYVPIVTLSSKDNVNRTKELNEGFKRCYVSLLITATLVIPDALRNNSLSHFVILDALCNNSLSHFVIR